VLSDLSCLVSRKTVMIGLREIPMTLVSQTGRSLAPLW